MGRGPNKTLQLMVLGFLEREPSHPYGMVASLRRIGAESWMKLNPSAVYYTFERLAEAGWVEVSERVPGDGRPDRTVYQITPSGRARLPGLVAERFTKQLPIHPPLYPGLLYFEALPNDELAAALSVRIEMLEGLIQTLDAHLSYDGDFGLPLQWLLSHAIALNRAELQWCRDFRASLDASDEV